MEEKIERQAKELKTLVYYSYQYAGVAQLAEQYFRKVEVASSTLASGSNGINVGLPDLSGEVAPKNNCG